MTGELTKKEICKDCPIENPVLGNCYQCRKGHEHWGFIPEFVKKCKHDLAYDCRLDFKNPDEMCWYENEITCWLKHKKNGK